MGKLKIIHLITRLEPGGSSKNTIESAVHQSERADVLVARGPCENEYGGIPVRTKLIKNLARSVNPLKDAAAFLEIYSLISGEKPDILHTHTSKAGILGRLAAAIYGRRARGRKMKVIHTPHGHVFYGYFGRFLSMFFILLERLAARFADRLVALSKGEKDESLAFGIKGEWRVVHSGISLPENRPPKKPEDLRGKIVAGTVARFEKVKGVEYFLRAAKIVSEKSDEAFFLVVGDGSLKKNLERLCAKLGIAGRTRFAGFQEDVYKFISAMDIYVQPSLNEGLGRTVIEAQFLGKPVVASKVCGIKDIVTEGENGFLVEPGNHRALAEKIVFLTDNSQKREEMARSAAETAREKDFTGYSRFSAESMNAKLDILYNELLEEKRRADA